MYERLNTHHTLAVSLVFVTRGFTVMLSIWDLDILAVEKCSVVGCSRPAEHVDDFVLLCCGLTIL